MGGEPPDDANVVEITSATYGSKDVTTSVNSSFQAYYSTSPRSRSYSLAASNAVFGDPNPNVLKAFVVVWRYSFKVPNGEVLWSDFKSLAATEGASVTLTWGDTNITPWQSPAPGPNGLYVIAAYWFNSNRTSSVSGLARQWANPYKGLVLNVSPGSLGADPNPSLISEQFTVVYGTWVAGNYWDFQTSVGNGSGSWTLTLPLCFPPLSLPNMLTKDTYVTFQNRQFDRNSTNVVIYPVIYDALSRDMVWDGRKNSYGISKGGSRDLHLVNDAGCEERGKYFLGFTTADGETVRGCWDTYVIATSSAMRPFPFSCYWQWTIDGVEVLFDYANYNKPYKYSSADLRLNIYSVTWGSSDVTDIIRQQYISQTINDPNYIPSDTSNQWSIPASNTTLVKDPNPGGGKVCVIVYRLAYKIGETDGLIQGYNDPKPWEAAYTTNKIQPVHTNRYPVLRDYTAFYWKAAREGTTINFNLLTEPTDVWAPPNGPTFYPYIAAAVWCDRGVTGWVQDYLDEHPSNSGAVSVPVSTSGMGTYIDVPDPWIGVAKQLTCLVGYAGGGTDSNHVVWKTYVDLGTANPWYFSLPKTAAPPKFPQQMPVPNELPPVDLIWYRNRTAFDVWPNVVVDNGTVVWDGGRKDNPDLWKIAPNTDKTIKLSALTSCQENNFYSPTFDVSADTYPPFSGWVRHSALEPQWLMTMTYGMNSTEPWRYTILKEMKKLGS
ncbi:uncharacterized protein KY384_008850 [Bacidia gigantensis]|uniref:uncharacterized protein n=1 Tax=Bacidia gigantensis TaxID=2732470 RepID=UPI001D03BCCE|nr:uncharacterized protein KY384_008850 [Bacidia gigantensis]KAG8525206.1 hypothetical protein KY384_008850 [Bacidia gigantensis]